MLIYVLGGIAAVMALLLIYVATSRRTAPVRAAVAQAVAAPAGPVLAPSHEQLLARLVTPAFEDAVDKKRAARLYDAMLASYVEQRYPGEVGTPAPKPASPTGPKPA